MYSSICLDSYFDKKLWTLVNAVFVMKFRKVVLCAFDCMNFECLSEEDERIDGIPKTQVNHPSWQHSQIQGKHGSHNPVACWHQDSSMVLVNIRSPQWWLAQSLPKTFDGCLQGVSPLLGGKSLQLNPVCQHSTLWWQPVLNVWGPKLRTAC